MIVIVVAFVESGSIEKVSVAFLLCFRYCVFAKNKSGGNDYERTISSKAMSILW